MNTIVRLLKWTLCRLGFHLPDRACTIKQRFYRPEDGVLEYTRVAEECAWCHKRFIFWDWHHAHDGRESHGPEGEGPDGRRED